MTIDFIRRVLYISTKEGKMIDIRYDDVNKHNELTRGILKLKEKKKELLRELEKFIITDNTPGIIEFISVFKKIQDARNNFIKVDKELKPLKIEFKNRTSELNYINDIYNLNYLELEKERNYLSSLSFFEKLNFVKKRKIKDVINIKESVTQGLEHKKTILKFELNNIERKISLVNDSKAITKFKYGQLINQLSEKEILSFEDNRLEQRYEILEKDYNSLLEMLSNKEYYIPKSDLNGLLKKMELEEINHYIEQLEKEKEKTKKKKK